MTPSEYREWATYEALEPFGSIRDDWRLGYMLASLANMMRGKNQVPFGPLDFAPESVQTWVNSLRKTGEEDRAEAGGGVDVVPPKSQNTLIFEDMYKAHVNHSPT